MNKQPEKMTAHNNRVVNLNDTTLYLDNQMHQPFYALCAFGKGGEQK